MKIYISADIEGVSGVVNSSHTTPKGYDYNRARILMTDEVNAAIRGAKLAGVEEILVNDSHGPMTNILIEKLDEDACLITGNQKLLGMMEGINKTYDAVMFIGYHAKHNTPGVLAHSYYGTVVSEIKINDEVVGEFEFNTMIAGHYGVPVIFVSGDDVLAQQVKKFNSNITTLTVKDAHSRYTAKCIPPKKVHKLMEENIYKALKYNKNLVKPCNFDGKIELEVAFLNSGMAEIGLLVPGTTMIEPNRLKYTAKDIIEAYKMRSVLTTLAASTL